MDPRPVPGSARDETGPRSGIPAPVAQRAADPWVWMVALGVLQVVAGGLVAALTGPLALPRGSWLAAYLVLVGGVAQYAMGRVGGLSNPARTPGARPNPARTSGVLAVLGWNAGNALVITGTLASVPPLVVVGAAMLAAALVVASWPVAFPDAGSRLPTRLRVPYLVLVAILLVSMPTGILLAYRPR